MTDWNARSATLLRVPDSPLVEDDHERRSTARAVIAIGVAMAGVFAMFAFAAVVLHSWAFALASLPFGISALLGIVLGWHYGYARWQLPRD